MSKRLGCFLSYTSYAFLSVRPLRWVKGSTSNSKLSPWVAICIWGGIARSGVTCVLWVDIISMSLETYSFKNFLKLFTVIEYTKKFAIVLRYCTKRTDRRTPAPCLWCFTPRRLVRNATPNGSVESNKIPTVSSTVITPSHRNVRPCWELAFLATTKIQIDVARRATKERA